jgi:N-acyl homoserine lactone hydrolase
MKKIALMLLIVMAIALGAFLWTFTAAKIEFTPLPMSVSLPIASPPPDMTISALPTGSMESRGVFAYRGGSLGDKRFFTMTAFLVHHPRGDLLFDAGFGSNVDEQIKQEPWALRTFASYTKGKPAGQQLAENNYALDRFAGVVLTHAHWDHVSGLDSLPGVPVWVSSVERAFIASGSSKAALMASFANVNYKQYDFTGGPYLGFPVSLDVWGDGSIVLVPAPGHTPGSIIAFITLPSGTRYAMLGDLVWQNEGVDIPAERPWFSRRLVAENDTEVRENIARIAAIHARFPEMHMVPAHEPRAVEGIPVFPAAGR